MLYYSGFLSKANSQKLILLLIINLTSESPPTFDGRYGAINYFVECLIEVEELHRTGLEIKLENPVKSNLLVSPSLRVSRLFKYFEYVNVAYSEWKFGEGLGSLLHWLRFCHH